MKGEQLVASLFIANERKISRTNLKVIDPDDDSPIIRLTEHQADEMEAKADRVVLASALGAIGLSELAIELSLSPDIDAGSYLLRPSEASRLRSSREDRFRRASDEASKMPFATFTDRGRTYAGREAAFELPPTGGRIPFRSVRVRQGIDASLIAELARISHTMFARWSDLFSFVLIFQRAKLRRCAGCAIGAGILWRGCGGSQ